MATCYIEKYILINVDLHIVLNEFTSEMLDAVICFREIV
jgi:hypothetical protein